MASSEIRYAEPKLNKLVLVNNSIKQGVPVTAPDGRRGVRPVIVDPGMAVTFENYVGDRPVGTLSYQFSDNDFLDKEETQPNPLRLDAVKVAAGVDFVQAYADALDTMTNVFPVLADPDPTEAAVGPKVWLNLDSWSATLGTGDRSMEATIGFYSHPDCKPDQVTHYEVLWFGDAGSRAARQRNVDNMVRNKATAQAVVDGDDPRLAEMDEDGVAAAQDQATEQIIQLNAEIARLEAQHTGVMEDLLAIPAIQSASIALMQGVAATLIANDATWTDVDAALVVASFSASLAGILSA